MTGAGGGWTWPQSTSPTTRCTVETLQALCLFNTNVATLTFMVQLGVLSKEEGILLCCMNNSVQWQILFSLLLPVTRLM